MALVLHDLLGYRELGLRLVTGEDSPEITFACVNEQVDPTPYVRPGWMVLTTGIAISPSSRDWAPYVDRLRRSGIDVLGFGVGLRHPAVPGSLVSAARRRSLTVVEVPERTMFADIAEIVNTRAVSSTSGLAVAQSPRRFRALLRASSTMPVRHALTARLAEEIQGWALFLDASGTVLASSSEDAVRSADLVADLIERVSPTGARGTSMHDCEVTILPVGTARHPLGWLAVGHRRDLLGSERLLCDIAVALLAQELSGDRMVRQLRGRTKSVMLGLLLDGDVASALRLARGTGEDLGRRLVRLILVKTASTTSPDLADELLEAGDWACCCRLSRPGRYAILVPDEADTVESAIVVAGRHGDGVIGEPIDVTQVQETRDSLLPLLDSVASAQGIVPVRDLAAAGLATQLNTPAIAAWARDLLKPLWSESAARIDLFDTVREFLLKNNNSEAAGSVLGIHRRTVDYRLGKAERLLGLSLSDPIARAEILMAIQIQQRNPDKTCT